MELPIYILSMDFASPINLTKKAVSFQTNTVGKPSQARSNAVSMNRTLAFITAWHTFICLFSTSTDKRLRSWDAFEMLFQVCFYQT